MARVAVSPSSRLFCLTRFGCLNWRICGSSPPTSGCGRRRCSCSVRCGRGRVRRRTTAEVSRYAGGRYKELRHVQARTTSAGYRVQGGAASLRVWEDGIPIVASVWIGEGDPLYETETGPLQLHRSCREAVALAAVGPVAWSEGMRMAANLYAGRVVDEDGEQA
ncbi:hypothetical protein V2I01_29680 [Micromonospora sp. BRA006-A]|nr:hypothetical protein [Micromonospora sp. BRA006-A]